MQFKIHPMHVKTIIEDSGSSVSSKSERYVFAGKPTNNGVLRIRMKQPRDPYNAQHYWLCTVHFERGLRPNRYFNSAEVKKFAEQYIQPYSRPLACMRLIEHWIQRNEEHQKKYAESADQAKKIGLSKAAEAMRLAVEKSRDVSTHLREAFEHMQANGGK
jgi:hypothetical protein